MAAVATRQPKDILVADVIYREDLYPRSLTNPERVQDYAENLEGLPPIEVNQHNILIDGWHRWTAHRKVEKQHIRVCITETASEAQLLALAVERNATHGLQLSMEDKERYARATYHLTPTRERAAKRKILQKTLSVSEATLNRWLSRIDKDTKEANQRRAVALWLACHTHEEIAKNLDIPKGTIDTWMRDLLEFDHLTESKQSEARHLTDFDPPLYNVWKQQDQSQGPKHPGNSEVRWVDNLLYLYTQPLDIVVDPFAGSGSTINLCKKRWRRYYVSDRKPIVEREGDIRQWDITTGLPPVPRWQDVRLIYLDPPYWKQAEGAYSQDPTDLANMDLPLFTQTLAGIIRKFGQKLSPSATIALVMQPTQWKAPDRRYTDHVADMLRAVKLPLHMRISVPYESQQCTAQMVEWAKATKQCLVLSREIVVWKVGV